MLLLLLYLAALSTLAVAASDACGGVCKAHEVCGPDVTGISRCLCGDAFTAKYKDTLGDPTQCSENSASFSIAECLLAEKGLNFTSLHMNDPSCRGALDPDTHMVDFTFNNSKTCGAVITAGDRRISYSNSIQVDKLNISSDQISRQGKVNVSFSCFYNQPETTPLRFTVKGGAGLKQVASGSWDYSLKMRMCEDAACSKLTDLSSGMQSDKIIYISIETQGLDGKLIKLLVKDCWATGKGKGKGKRYDLMTNGCGNPKDSSVSVVSSSSGGTLLRFQMFQFKGDDTGINLQFKLKLCVKKSKGCEQKCNKGKGKNKRSLKNEDLFIVSVPLY